MMHLIEAFVAGTIAGVVIVALYYRRAALKLEGLKRDIEAKAHKL